jgi:hypothetical protein
MIAVKQISDEAIAEIVDQVFLPLVVPLSKSRSTAQK